MQHETLVITGGFGILGQALAQAALAQGYRVALVDVAPRPATLAPALQVEDVALHPGRDLQDPEAASAVLDAIAARFGHIDALANVAGGFTWETVTDGQLATWDRMFGQNLRTAMNMSRAVVPHMVARGSGAIVNVGAGGALRAAAGMGAYAASKSAVHRLTESMAEEFKSTGVRVNAVLPSIIDTPANRADMPDADFNAWVMPADLARVMLFLCSEQARAMTGALVPVAGRV